jgi:hypothetical protein
MKSLRQELSIQGHIPSSRQTRHELCPFSPKYNLQITLAIELDKHLLPDEPKMEHKGEDDSPPKSRGRDPDLLPGCIILRSADQAVTTQIASRATGTADALNYLLHGPLNGAVVSMGLGHQLRDGFDHLPTTDHRYAECLAYVSLELEMANSKSWAYAIYPL